jgi:hypothetical protein
MAAVPVSIYNTAPFQLTPLQGTYQHVVSTLTMVDSGVYDYTFFANLDINLALADFSYLRNMNGAVANTHQTAGEIPAWTTLHNALNTGAGLTGQVTTYSDADTSNAPTWTTFWAGIISQCIDNEDTDGISVKIPTLKTTLNDDEGLNSSNDILGSLNYSMRNTFGGDDSVPVDIDIAPDASENYLAALYHFIYVLKGVVGFESRVNGDPSDGQSRFKFLAGDQIGLRFSCTVNNTKSGLIRLTQI